MNYFTSDLHLGHRNIIRLCNRPFATIEEMDETLIRNWNAKVTNGDTVYILGDLLFRNEKPAEEYLKQLKGKKHPIIGNHDRDWVKKCNLEDFFESVNNLHFISDGKRQMTLCHYPMMSWPHMTRCYMVFGHIHGNTDADYWPLIRENDLMLNAGADVNGFAPVTFEEMQENNYRHKAGWNPELCTMNIIRSLKWSGFRQKNFPSGLMNCLTAWTRRMLALLLRRREKTPVSSAPTSGLNSSTRQLKLR